ncbi:WD repeat-containing and planar cell polarity effector protein fritz isoform X2 [Anticarsia gemmatalis]|uniref:WD repeat-containing and planar cell polarity effector protein fritz isoform X2 n=1 Tax=Anticarsia gemmatalis TaxID=129554 RepID=UPI003F775A72
MINYDIKFLTSDETVQVKNSDFKSFKYETKKRVDQTVYDSGKRSYCERRGGLWRAAHPRQIRQLESKLRDRSIIVCEWSTDTLITIVFSSGVIAYLTVKPHTLDVTQILFDRYFVGKLSGQAVSNVALGKSHILLTHSDRTATLVTFGKNNINLPCRISDRDPHLQNIELGGSSRRTERYISTTETFCRANPKNWQSNGGRVLVWSVTVAEPAPWSPVVEDHANLHLYTINGHQISLTAYHQLENETLSAELSFKGDNVIHIVEQVTCHKNGINLQWLRYDVSGTDERATKLCSSRESATHVSLSTPVRVVRRSPCDARLLIACIDGSLHVVHCVAGLTHTTRAGFIATSIRWAGELIIAAEEGGRLQCFDRALSLLHHHSKCLELTSYLRDSRRMQVLATRNARNGPIILLSFSGGPLSVLHITHPRLLPAWIRMKRLTNAVGLLRAMDWEREGTECLWAINKIVCVASRSKAESVVCEGAAQSALGVFLAPRAPLGAAAARFAPPLHDLARKFFHHLLRRGRVEKALSLGVDLAAWDLFADVRWAARRLQLHHLTHEAAALAASHAAAHSGSECSESCSGCSSRSYSESEDESAASEVVKTKPPPLPRVSLPNLPTMMQVPIAQAEPTSTNSIRPNLHQYLERDNTIWTTDVRDSYTRVDYERDYPKPLRNAQNVRWHSMDVLSNYKSPKHGLMTINEAPVKPTHTVVDIIPRPHDDRLTSTHFKHLYQTELREEVTERSNTLYRYQNNNNYHPSTSLKDRTYRMDNEGLEKPVNRSGEKNKVKFSDTVTIAVVSQEPEPARELAASLPLCPPHKYLAAFTPQQHLPPPAPPVPPPGPAQQLAAADNAPPKPPKIKVVHFGMV